MIRTGFHDTYVLTPFVSEIRSQRILDHLSLYAYWINFPVYTILFLSLSKYSWVFFLCYQDGLFFVIDEESFPLNNNPELQFILILSEFCTFVLVCPWFSHLRILYKLPYGMYVSSPSQLRSTHVVSV